MSYISDGTQKPVQMRHTAADALESLATIANRHSAAILQLPRRCSSFPANSAAVMPLLPQILHARGPHPCRRSMCLHEMTHHT